MTATTKTPTLADDLQTVTDGYTTKTPRTDQEEAFLGRKNVYEEHLVRAEFARMLESELDALRLSFSDAEKDKARLDWLQLHREDLSIHRDLRRDKTETIYVDCAVTGALAYGENVRAALDVAIAGEPK